MLPMLALIQSAPSPAALANDVTPRIAWSLRQSSSRKLFSPKLLRPSLHVVETTETYYSDPIRLEAGHMIFTDIERTPLAMPEGAYFVTEFFGDIVDADTHEPSPLDALYDHHWIAVADNHKNRLCPNYVEYVFGVGAESRNNPVSIPAGYGYLVTPDTRWYANIHLLRTQGLAGDNAAKAAKECNECYYAPGKGCTPAQNGSFLCCGEGDFAGVSSCPTSANPPPPRDYVLRYTVRYTRSLDALTPLQVGTFTAPACLPFYAVHRNDSHPEHRVDNSMRIPASSGPIDVRFAVGHLHTGGINISLTINGRVACTSYPR